jgi:hypothetical protein
MHKGLHQKFTFKSSSKNSHRRKAVYLPLA